MFAKKLKLIRQDSSVCDYKGWAFYQDAEYDIDAIVDTDKPLPAELDIYELRAMGKAVIYLAIKSRIIIYEVY